jgi:hypothetical protein
VPEVRKLLLQIVWGYVIGEEQAWHWSHWRRRHQYTAKYHHYRRRGAKLPKVNLQL